MSSNPALQRSQVWRILAPLSLIGGFLGILMLLPPSQLQALQAPPLTPHVTAFDSPIGNPQLSLAKSVDNPAPLPNGEITYTLTYSNTNQGSQAFNVRIYDFLPAGVQFISAEPAPALQENGTLLFTAPSVGPGTGNTQIKVRARVLDGYPQLYNHALAAADGVTPVRASLLTTVTSVPLVQRALALTKFGESVEVINHLTVYRIRCQNIDPNPINQVVLMDVMPTGMAFVSASPAPRSIETPVLEWGIGDLASGATWEGVVTVTTPSYGGIMTNTLIADAQQSLITRRAAFATQVFTQMAILSTTQQAQAPVIQVGHNVIYRIRFWNEGNITATQMVLTDTLPGDITVLEANPPATTFIGGNVGVWQIGNLPPDSERVLVITATVQGTPGRVLHNRVEVAASGAIGASSELDVLVSNEMNIIYLPIVIKR